MMYEFTEKGKGDRRGEIIRECAVKEYELTDENGLIDILISGCEGWLTLDTDDLLEEWKELCCKDDDDIQEMIDAGDLYKASEMDSPKSGYPVTLIFGSRACALFEKGERNPEKLYKAEGCSEAVVERVFETEAERKAFIEGSFSGIDWSYVDTINEQLSKYK